MSFSVCSSVMETIYCFFYVVIGVFWQISGETVGEVRIVSDMHERKAAMAQEADAFIALPGI